MATSEFSFMKPTIQEFVKWGLDREIPELILPPVDRMQINLGPGDRKIIPGTIGVGPSSNKLTKVEWEWRGMKDTDDGYEPVEPIPFHDSSLGAVHAHQFMEHFSGDDAIGILGEIERILVPGGVAFITTPYPDSGHFFQALDHKSMWTEETWNWLFDNTYYNNGRPWKLKVHACFLAAVVRRNLDMFTQLVKVED